MFRNKVALFHLGQGISGCINQIRDKIQHDYILLLLLLP